MPKQSGGLIIYKIVPATRGFRAGTTGDTLVCCNHCIFAIPAGKHEAAGMEKESRTLVFPEKKWDSKNLQELAEALHEHYHLLIKYFLVMFNIPPEDQEDLFNHIFLKITKGLYDLKHYNNLKSWVVTIAKNEIFSYLQKRERELRIYCVATDEVIAVTKADQESAYLLPPEKELLAKQLRAAMNECLERLDPRNRAPFLLRYREGMKWREVGATLSVNIDTARKRADKARIKVLKSMKTKFGNAIPL